MNKELCLIYDATQGTPEARPLVRQLWGFPAAQSQQDVDEMISEIEKDDGVGYGTYGGFVWGEASQALTFLPDFVVDVTTSPGPTLHKKAGMPTDPNEVP